MTKNDDDLGLDLEGLFAEARESRTPVDERLTARIIADAHAMQPEAAQLASPVPRSGLMARALELLGGWPAVGGLVTATAAGLYIGFAQPALLMEVEDLITEPSFATSSFLPGDDMFFEEG